LSGIDQYSDMTAKERAVDIGSRRGKSIVLEMGRELRMARLDHGLSQAAVATAARTSRSQVGRVERGEASRVSVAEIARLLAVVGLELSARAYPAGPPIRDAAHLALLGRFRATVAPSVAWRTEVPVGNAGDSRAWDAVMLVDTIQIALEVETRPRDVQALQRRVALKRRDDPEIAGVVLLLARTRHNRALLKAYGESLRAEFPLPSSVVMESLGAGRSPGGSGIVMM
jgi:transcriptional regulator with XRE-family HTH domain